MCTLWKPRVTTTRIYIQIKRTRRRRRRRRNAIIVCYVYTIVCCSDGARWRRRCGVGLVGGGGNDFDTPL